ncbi:MAG: SpoIIE family protein phosphatase [bacterium]|nr:SpoIIE family protein phosphatase [bacterium]
MNNKKKIHPIVRFNYLPRNVGLILLFIIMITIFHGSRNYLMWGIFAWFAFIWPHLAYAHARNSRDSKKAEFRNMYLELFSTGFIMNFIDFMLFPTLAMFLEVTMNTMATGGPAFLRKGLLLIAAGIGISGLIMGFSFNPDSPLVTSLLCISVVLIYSYLLAYLNYVNAKKLIRSKKSLEQTKNKLWSEMELAYKIQTVLLPKKPNIPGYEIAAYMEPASEVGGDYYDIINQEETDWIIIGDVSGHGVPAGLIMMMVQTAIHAVVNQNKNLNPSQLLDAINKTITDNIQQLDEDKYMTITVLTAHSEGTFIFSGLHQDIFVYRARSESIEVIETNGIWIGLSHVFKDASQNYSFTLEPGDCLLLYTDGITEATPIDWQGKDRFANMFGAEKLQKTFLSCGEKSPDEIKEKIIVALDEYLCLDDVTLVVIKRVT